MPTSAGGVNIFCRSL